LDRIDRPGPHKGATISLQPRIRKGAFFDAAWRHGCRSFSVYNRTYVTSTFGDPVAEYWHVIEHAGLWPAMGERQVAITGPDAARFVQLLTPRDMSNCAIGQCKYAVICGEDGGVICDPIILRLGEREFWLSTSDCDLELWAKGVAVHAGMDVTIRDAGISVMQVQGPKSPGVLTALFGEAVLDLGNYRMMEVPFAGGSLAISRTGWSGEFGYELYLRDASKGDALFDALLEAGQPYNLAPGCVSQIRRIESGILSWGIDVTPAENPFEVGLGRLVELDAPGEFVGKRALERLATEPLRRELVGLAIEGAALASNEEAWPLSVDGAPAGRLTSLAWSPRLERNIALGVVDIGHAAPGSALEVETWDGPRQAMVSALPFLPKLQAGSARALFGLAGA
jgi:aminomethyltransferase